MSEKIIELKNVTKTFQFSSPSSNSNFLSGFNFRKPKKTVIALNDVSFSVEKGEILGIIGLNGSGKSTLLQTVAGLYLPDSGFVGVNGTLAPVLTIGAGFNQELLPSENIVLYGMLLGFSKSSIKEKIDKILQFAEI
ncbi:MAG TPA: ATP-binding cassette domain-containing protein [Candidatus Paceibacterota bacterium]|nr:ATP-binding cassette domain-containing protein [Candidatus Paceibacterota bacterium]